MIDLTQYADIEFYAGKPKEASRALLRWDDSEYTMDVKSDVYGNVTAEMSSGNMVWRCGLNTENLKAEIDAALEDACDLGHSANYSPDPER